MRKKDRIEEFRKRVLQREIMHTTEFMQKHLPKSGPFANRFHLVELKRTSGTQIWECDFIHNVYPGYRKTNLKLTLSIVARASKWLDFKIKIDVPPDIPDVENIRIQRDVARNIRWMIRTHLQKYF